MAQFFIEFISMAFEMRISGVHEHGISSRRCKISRDSIARELQFIWKYDFGAGNSLMKICADAIIRATFAKQKSLQTICCASP